MTTPDPNATAEGGAFSSGTATPTSTAFTHSVTASGASTTYGRAFITSDLSDAIYGVAVYGDATYGGGTEPPPPVPGYTSELTVRQYNYTEVLLSWGAPVTPDWQGLRLLRSTYGIPATFADGDILLDEDWTGGFSTSYDDVNRLPGKRYYYGLFLFNGLLWFRVAEASVLVPYDYQSGPNFLDRLPPVWRDVNGVDDLVNADGDNAVLEKFCNLFGYHFDVLRTSADGLLDLVDPSLAPAEVLPAIAQMHGSGYEPAFGAKQSRVLVRNLLHLYRLRGTEQGIIDLIAAYTGWTATLDYSRNLMLSVDQSSFESSLSTWGPGNDVTYARLSRIGGIQSTTDDRVFSHRALEMSLRQTVTVGTLEMNSCGAPAYTPPDWWTSVYTPWYADIDRHHGYWPYPTDPSETFSLSPTPEMIQVAGVPVSAGLDYTASAYVRAASTVRGCVVGLYYYDVYGNLITQATSTHADATDWSTRISVMLTAPADGFALVGLFIPGVVTGEIHYLDAVQIEQASAPTDYAMPRWVDVAMTGADDNTALKMARLQQVLKDYLPVGLRYSLAFTPA